MVASSTRYVSGSAARAGAAPNATTSTQRTARIRNLFIVWPISGRGTRAPSVTLSSAYAQYVFSRRSVHPVSSLIVCHACDLVQRLERPDAPARLRCARCRAELWRRSGARRDQALALCATALLLLGPSLSYPLMSMSLEDATRATTLPGAASALFLQGYPVLGSLVLVTAILVPLVQLLALSYVLASLAWRASAPGAQALLRLLALLRPWAMSEVFLLGALVALVKLAGLAQVLPGIALACYAAFMVVLAALAWVAPPEQVWAWIEEAGWPARS